ncbi:MAG TPA: MMPL family transporter [Mycobacteriales bacterium]
MAVDRLRRRLPGPVRAAARRAGRAYRAAVVRGRWVVVGAWLVLAAGLTFGVPAGGGGGGGLGDLLPPDSHAVEVQQRSLAEFRVPVLSETSVVVHDPGGLTLLTRADVALWALSHTQASLNGSVPDGPGHVIAAIPVPTSTPDTAVTYLYVSSGTSLEETDSLAREYARHFRNQASVSTYVTGITPAQVRQAHYLNSRLELFELASLVLIAVVVALVFHSLVAPVAVLAVAGIGYLVAQKLLGLLAAALGFALPDQLKPLIVALLLGVVTDYSVLFFSDFRRQLGDGSRPQAATVRTLRQEASVVTVAGLTVAGGTIALLAANLQLFRAFGPALALTVLIGLAVSLTLVPALMAVLGGHLFRTWGGGTMAPAPADASSSRFVHWLVRVVSARRGAALALGAGVAVLLAAATPVLWMRFDLSFTSGLPAYDQVQRGADVLTGSGVRGVTAPTEVLISAEGIGDRRDALDRLQRAVAREPGVAEVLGPAQNPLPQGFGVVLSTDGDTARLVVILDSDPLAAAAVSDLQALQDRLPALAAAAGLPGAQVDVTGQTAIAAELAQLTGENLRLTLLAALAVELLILVLYLRALATPVVLLACSALGVAAALGLTVVVFQGLRDNSGLTFYAPFATAVLLLALGSDYNVFSVGSIWSAAGRWPLARALAIAMPRSTRAITAAGLILATTFAVVAVIPLETFRQVAFTMTAGLLIDTLIVRPVLTPAVLTLLGPAASWPSRRIRTGPDPAADELVPTGAG